MKTTAAATPLRTPEVKPSLSSRRLPKVLSPARAPAIVQCRLDGDSDRQRHPKIEAGYEDLVTAARGDTSGFSAERTQQKASPGGAAPPPPSGGGTPLPPATQAKMETAFGADFSAVRVHQGLQAQAMGALAYTQGTDIHFAPGQYDPEGLRGQRLLGHELAHVLQQSEGRVRAPSQAKGATVTDDPALEREANELGDKAARGEYVGDGSQAQSLQPHRAVIQAQPGPGPVEEPIRTELGIVTLEQSPSRGQATLQVGGMLFAVLFWEPAAGRKIDKIRIGTGDASPSQGIGGASVVEITIQADFAVDAVIDGMAEQSITTWKLQTRVQWRHHLLFAGRVQYRNAEGAQEAKRPNGSFAYEYTPYTGRELEVKVPPRAIDPGKALPLTPSKPAPQPLPTVWKHKDAESYDRFATSHSNTKWAEIVTPAGEHIAWALTVEAITRMAEKLRAGKRDFEFLADYPGSKVASVHIGGVRLTSLDVLADLYFRTRDAALDGAPGMLPESEVYGMEGQRFGRKGLGHSQALVRWNEIKLPTKLVARKGSGSTDGVIVPVPIRLSEVETLPGHSFQGLRVKGDQGMQTIYPESLDDPKRRAELLGDFKSFDPIADGLEPPPSNLPYEKIVSTLKALFGRKRAVAAGREPPDALDRINERIAQLTESLRAQGINLEESKLLDALDEGRDLKQVRGQIIVSPDPPHYYGKPFTFRLVLDYVPPNARVEIGWRWKALKDEALFVDTRDKSTRQSFTLDSFLFWEVARDNDVGKAGGFEVLAYIYLNGADKPIAPVIRSGWIALDPQEEPPATLTIAGNRVVVKETTTTYRIAEWVPRISHYSVDWSNGSKLLAADTPVLSCRFPDVGSVPIKASIYRVERMLGIRKKTLIRETNLDVTVEDAETAGTKLFPEMKQQQRGLADLEYSMVKSMAEIEGRVAAAGGQQAYWQKRLELEQKRLAKLRELAPDLRTQQSLPSDATQLDAALAYSGPIAASLVLPSGGGAQALAIQVTMRKEGAEWKARLLDVTGEVLKFDGSGATPLAAYSDAWKTWEGNNPYPKDGVVVYDFAPPGWTLGKSFSTYRVGKVVEEWVDSILMIGGLVVAGLLLAAPEATITKVLGGLLLAASVARGTVKIAENLSLGIGPLDSRNIIEAVGIITAFTGITGSVLRQVGVKAARPLVYQVGSWTVLATVAVDASVLVYASAEAIAQWRIIQTDPTLDESQRVIQLLRIVSTMLSQGLLFIVANKEMFKGGLKHSDFFRTDPKATAEAVRSLPPGETPRLETGARLDIAAELRKAGERPERLLPDKLSDAALIERYFALPWLKESLSAAEISELLNRFSTPVLKSLSNIPAARAKSVIDRIDNDGVVKELSPLLKGEGLAGLLDATSGKSVAELHGAFGAAGTAELVSELGAPAIGRLLNPPRGTSAQGVKGLSEQLGTPALKNLSNAHSGNALHGADIESLIKRHGAGVMKNLGQDLTGPEVVSLVKEYGAKQVDWAGADLTGHDAEALLAQLKGKAVDDVAHLMSRPARDARGLIGEVLPTGRPLAAPPPSTTPIRTPSGPNANAKVVPQATAPREPTINANPGPVEAGARNALPEKKRKGFDLFVEELRSRGKDPEKVLAKMGPDKIEDQADKSLRIFDEKTKAARQWQRAQDDPLNPSLEHNEQTPGGVWVHYENHRPKEVAQAEAVHQATGEEVHIFGDTASGIDYPGIDGVIGSPRRPLSLKNADSPLANANLARKMASDALDAAVAHGYSQVEVHIGMKHKTVAELKAAWNQPPPLATDPPNRPYFRGDAVSRIVIHASDGFWILTGPL